MDRERSPEETTQEPTGSPSNGTSSVGIIIKDGHGGDEDKDEDGNGNSGEKDGNKTRTIGVELAKKPTGLFL